MTLLLVLALASALWLGHLPRREALFRARVVLRSQNPDRQEGWAQQSGSVDGNSALKQRSSPESRRAKAFWPRVTFRHRLAQRGSAAQLTGVVLQMAALLQGGRQPPRMWEDLLLVHGDEPITAQGAAVQVRSSQGAVLNPVSQRVIRAACAATALGLPAAEAIRRTVAAGSAAGDPLVGMSVTGGSTSAHYLSLAFRGTDAKEIQVWSQVAGCLEVAEASGCPLADVLSRFAAQLEAEEDAEAARQSALAGPRATVTLLTWLPVLGLGVGMALGVDPLSSLLGTPAGVGALCAGVVLTVTGRIWSARLVANAANGILP